MWLRTCLGALTCLLANLLLAPISVSPASEVDVEIVLAVDASGSVDRDELRLQLEGIAAAFRDPAVQTAIVQGPRGSVMASMLIWSDAAFSKHPTDWFHLDSQASAETFAREVERIRDATSGVSAIGGGGTGLGDGLAFALGMIRDNGVDATRRIVDVSGDGRETKPWNKGAVVLPRARVVAAAEDVAVNGLAIVIDDAGLLEWYRNNVILGTGSFAMKAHDFEDFKRAIRIKLLRELAPPAIGEGVGRGHRHAANE